MDQFGVSSQLLNLGSEALKMAQATIQRVGVENWTKDQRQAASELLTALTHLTTAGINGMQIAVEPQAPVETTQTTAPTEVPTVAEPEPNGTAPASRRNR